MLSSPLIKSQASQKSVLVLQPSYINVSHQCQKKNNESIGKHYPCKNGY